MIERSKQTDELRTAKCAIQRDGSENPQKLECWFLHGAVGAASDWRKLASALTAREISTRSVDLWRFLQCESVSLKQFGEKLNAEVLGRVNTHVQRVLIGYSMGGRLALHALLESGPWSAAILISTHPGLREPSDAAARRATDSVWAVEALTSSWSDFLKKWESQAILAGDMRQEKESENLIQRRREIARSFVDWSLGAQEPLWERIGNLKIPILWVIGENDRKFRNLAEELAVISPNISLSIAPSCGHRVPWEAHDWLTEEIDRFIKKPEHH